MKTEELHAALADADGAIGLLSEKINAEFFDAAPRLRGYANYAVGFDNIDLEEASRRRIPVSNTPDVLTVATAELAWALLLAAARQVVPSDREMRTGMWPGWQPLQYLGAQVSGKVLGIVGAGRIGEAMGRMSKGFGMRVVYTTGSGRTNEQLKQEVGAELVSFEELLAQSDFISIHAPLTPNTRHLFNANTFGKMKSGSILINTGRGPVIDEAALVQALKNRKIAGAGLDVFEAEPAMAEGLAELDNVVITTHIGSATHTARNDMAVLAAENIVAMLEGSTPPTCLNPNVLS
jgi:glyoxylate reductase